MTLLYSEQHSFITKQNSQSLSWHYNQVWCCLYPGIYGRWMRCGYWVLVEWWAIPVEAWRGLRVPRGWGSQVSWQSAHEGGKVVSLSHRLPLPPTKYSWYSFLLGTLVAQWLRCCTTNRKFTSLVPTSVTGIFHWHKILPIALWPWGWLSL